MASKEIYSRLDSEEGQVWSWVLRIFLVALVIGIIITQCGPIIANHISIGSLAADAADFAADTYQSKQGNIRTVTTEVKEWLAERDARLAGEISVEYGQSGSAGRIYVPVRRIRNTFLFKNVGYLAPYTEAYSEGENDII